MSTTEVTSTQQLAAQQLQNDPRVVEAKRLVLQALEEHRGKLSGIRPSSPQLIDDYQSKLDEFGQMRGGNLYFPYLGSGLGNGPFVELADGSVKLDFITGIGVHGFGHSDPRVVAAGFDACLNDIVMHGNLQQGTISVDFMRTLLQVANETGAGLDHCFLTTSGAMANENALKIAFQKHAPADRIISFKKCFAGRTLALAQVTDKASYRVGLPQAINVDVIPFFDHNDPQGSTRQSVLAVRELCQRFPGQHAALWLELVQGEGGYYPGTTEYFKALIAEGKKHGLAIIADEIQSFSRTTRPFAFQHFELDGLIDIATVGKITQVCATLYRGDYKPQPGLISQTFTGSSWALLAGKAIIDGLVENGNFGSDGKNHQLHKQFTTGLKKIGEQFPNSISGPFGVGGMIAFTPFDGSMAKAKDLVMRMYHAGLLSFMAGGNPTRVRFLMPLGAVSPEHVDLALQVIEQIVQEMVSEN